MTPEEIEELERKLITDDPYVAVDPSTYENDQPEAVQPVAGSLIGSAIQEEVKMQPFRQPESILEQMEAEDNIDVNNNPTPTVMDLQTFTADMI